MSLNKLFSAKPANLAPFCIAIGSTQPAHFLLRAIIEICLALLLSAAKLYSQLNSWARWCPNQTTASFVCSFFFYLSSLWSSSPSGWDSGFSSLGCSLSEGRRYWFWVLAIYTMASSFLFWTWLASIKRNPNRALDRVVLIHASFGE